MGDFEPPITPTTCIERDQRFQPWHCDNGAVTASAYLLLVALAGQAFGSASLTITDADGLVLPGARVSLRGPAERTTVVDAYGKAVLADIPTGLYELIVDLPGFVSHREKITVSEGKTLSRTVVLDPAFLVHVDPIRGKPVQEWIMTGCDQVPPPALTDFANSVGAVARVRVVTQKVEDHVPPSAKQSYVVTRSFVRVLEAFKGHPHLAAVGRLSEVLQVGGEMDRGRFIEVVSRHKLLRRGAEYVVFLVEDSWFGGWTTAFCDLGVLRLDGDRVRSEGNDGFAREWEGKHREELLLALRNLQRPEQERQLDALPRAGQPGRSACGAPGLSKGIRR